MEEYGNLDGNSPSESQGSNSKKRWLIGIIAALAVAVLGLGYGYEQQVKVGHLVTEQAIATATVTDLQKQLNTVTDKMNGMVAAQQQAVADAAAQKANQSAGKAAGAHSAAKQGSATDKRYKQLQAQLTEQEKQLKETQDLVAKNRTDLEGNLNSTRDELNGSIAKTHEELVVLAKRGERSYFEFDLEKSKQFQRFGPLTLSLRKADTKHKNFDLQMIVDDNQLTKKKVNLYEPIWIHTENESQPVQVVVNRIDKNHVHGYVSAPKYKPSELAASGAGTVTPVSAHPETSTPNPQ
jgi:hypothetical protein